MGTLSRREQAYGGKAITQRIRKVDERFDANETNRLCCIIAVLVEIRIVPGTNGVDFHTLSIDQRLQYVLENEPVRLLNLDDLIDLLAFNLYGGKYEPAVQFLEKTMDSLEGRKSPEQGISKGITAVELSKKRFTDVKWFVKDLIPEGLTVIAGQSKIGKSWILMQLGLCVANGHDFIGGWNCIRNGVLYMSLEDTQRRMKYRQDKLGMTIPDNLHFKDEWTYGVDGLDQYLTQYPDVKMVMIDTWGRFNSGILEDQNNYQQVTKLAGQLHSIAKKHTASLVICTHTNKDSKRADWLDDVMGSKGLVSVSDTILKLSRPRGETDGELDITGRDVWERTLKLTCAENWLWLDTDPPQRYSTPQVNHVEEFDYVPDTNCKKCGGTGVYSYDDHEGHHTVHCDCGDF